jgi:hypothetical protein
LAVRYTYEITQIQNERIGHAVYANADCVTTHGESLPDFWQEIGAKYGIRASGPGAITAIGSWSIGGKRTKIYNGDAQFAHGKRAKRIEDTSFWKQLH